MVETITSNRFLLWTGNPFEIWTDNPRDKRFLRSRVPLPIGLKESQCPNCGSYRLIGAIVTDTADELDPDVLCSKCGYWWA